jgi:hypothetical protein
MFGVWLGFNPAALTGAAYVEMQQNAIRALNTSMPALGAVCIWWRWHILRTVAAIAALALALLAALASGRRDAQARPT